MKYEYLSSTDIKVSKICLGTMGFGEQVPADVAMQQLDFALDHGVNFIDTAEIYAVPPTEKTFGVTETIIGEWLQKSGKRNDIILASKVAGPSTEQHMRHGSHRLTKKNIEQALEGSLDRLQTDYLDLYQLHWPDRNVNMFGGRSFVYQEEEQMTPIEETLEALQSIVQSGKVRHVGLSNESPWGTMEFLRIAREKGYPRMMSVQNVYNLLNRHYEVAMAEVSIREDIGLLAYSPLAFGVLGGRYFDGAKPAGGRFTLHPDFVSRYRTPMVEEVTKKYAAVAQKHGLSLATMSLAFVNMQPFVTSNIIGASSVEQLQEDIESVDVVLSDEVLADVEAIQDVYPNVVA